MKTMSKSWQLAELLKEGVYAVPREEHELTQVTQVQMKFVISVFIWIQQSYSILSARNHPLPVTIAATAAPLEMLRGLL